MTSAPRTAHRAPLNAMNPSRDLIVAELHATFNGPAWHGPAVLEALDGVDHRIAARPIAPGRNTIWDLVLHLAHGRHILIERIRDATFDFPRAIREPWWPHPPTETNEDAWEHDRRLLDDYQHALLDAVRDASDAQLARVPAGSELPVSRQLLAMAIHDAYHAGQIRLLVLLDRDTIGALERTK
jgi:uncharacterized damage-inducible protein DinB